MSDLRRAEKTGNRRYRIQRLGWLRWRYVVVLQIEERGLRTSCIGGRIDTEWVTRWRDATVGDVSFLHGAHYGDARLAAGRV